jgi:hypothetical protein
MGVTDSMAFVNPGLRTQQQPIWIPQDPTGFTDQELTELNGASIANTTQAATIDAKGKVAVGVEQLLAAPGDDVWE